MTVGRLRDVAQANVTRISDAFNSHANKVEQEILSYRDRCSTPTDNEEDAGTSDDARVAKTDYSAIEAKIRGQVEDLKAYGVDVIQQCKDAFAEVERYSEEEVTKFNAKMTADTESLSSRLDILINEGDARMTSYTERRDAFDTERLDLESKQRRLLPAVEWMTEEQKNSLIQVLHFWKESKTSR